MSIYTQSLRRYNQRQESIFLGEDMEFLKKLLIGRAENPKIEFLRSLVVGAVATVADMGVMVLLKEALQLGAVASATVSYGVGIVVNYLLSNYWAFRHSNVKSGTVRFAVFTVIALIGLGINDLIIWAFEYPLAAALVFGGLLRADYYYILGKLVATVVVFFWNFFSRKLLLYRSEKAE